MSFVSTLQDDTYSGHMAKPYTNGTQTRIYRRTDNSSLTIDQFIGNGHAVGDDLFPISTVRSGWVVDVTLSQMSSSAIRETVQYNEGTPFDATWSSANPQNVEPTNPGYVNADIRSIQASATWWRYGDPSVYASGGAYPWDTADVPASFQCELELLTARVVDIAGNPMTGPVAQQELIVTTNWESNAAATAFRTRWQTLRNKRNDATWMGYPLGTLLFVGASTRTSSSDAMPVSDLRFVYDPFGHCRQRAISAEGGQFTPEFLVTVASPSVGPGACDDDDAPDFSYAKYVYWLQLHQSLMDFSSIMTPQQQTMLATMIT
tara:strand:- start:994 stop:1950 length:957 start_codon:yes stop_codon:yes gene_type:complete